LIITHYPDWWGLEVVLPPPSLDFLSHVPSVAHAIINFLTALSVANKGVAEILPFIRYISQYIDFEWNTIKSADQGQGVVCAATWIMPAAMVPRAWDFVDPPPPAPPAVEQPISTMPVYAPVPTPIYAPEPEGAPVDAPVQPVHDPALKTPPPASPPPASVHISDSLPLSANLSAQASQPAETAIVHP
jgi:hypothetical protein